MQCASSDCPHPALKMIAFPWAEPVAACLAHVGLAQQLMVNLGRENELRMFDLPPGEEEAPLTPRDPPELTTEAKRGAVLGPIVAGRLELELELERLRFARAELEHKVATVFAEAVLSLGKLRDHVPAFVEQLKEIIGQVRGEAPPDEPESVVEGATPPPDPPAPSDAPESSEAPSHTPA